MGKEGNCLSNSRFGEKSRNAQPSEEALRDLLRDECEPLTTQRRREQVKGDERSG